MDRGSGSGNGDRGRGSRRGTRRTSRGSLKNNRQRFGTNSKNRKRPGGGKGKETYYQDNEQSPRRGYKPRYPHKGSGRRRNIDQETRFVRETTSLDFRSSEISGSSPAFSLRTTNSSSSRPGHYTPKSSDDTPKSFSECTPRKRSNIGKRANLSLPMDFSRMQLIVINKGNHIIWRQSLG